MLGECIEGLNVRNGGIYFDGTLGGGGHSYEILKKSSPTGRLVATDLDLFAIGKANERLKEFADRYTIVNDNFKNIKEISDKLGIDGYDGIMLDLGVSSFQLDDKERGFSYLGDNELDMRMDRNNPFSALDVVNGYSQEKLTEIIRDYGEERFAFNIAKNIVSARKTKEIRTTGQLNEIIEKSIPEKFKHDGHPSKKTFQAIRIEVNGELDNLYETVLTMGRMLKTGGRLVILTFHSLEDRAVKKAFQMLECDCICPKDFPICVCDKRREVKILTKHPIIAGEEEMKQNSRSKSAKLRICEKI